MKDKVLRWSGRCWRYIRSLLLMKTTFVGKDLKRYRRLCGNDFCIKSGDYNPIVFDKKAEAGNLDEHYFLQDIYFAKMINQRAINVHYDIGSRVDGFISHLLAADLVKEVILIDIRPLGLKIEKLSFICDDVCKLSRIKDDSISSISSLHAIEHIGLGRYGDPVDPDGWKKALKNIQKKVKTGGYLYLGTPVGRVQKVCFNAHRVFKPSSIIDILDGMELVSFAFVHNMKVYKVDVSQMKTIESKLGDYDCGLFEFVKR